YMAELYSKYEVEGQLPFYEMSKYQRLSKMDKEIMDIVSELYKGNNQTIKGTLKGIVNDSYTNTLDIASKATGQRIKGILKPIDVTKTINTDMAGLRWTERTGKYRIDAIYDIQKEIKQGLTQGDTYGTMAKRLKGKLETDIKKANTIVRTESARVHSQAKEDSFDRIEKAGVVFKEQWISSQDERVRSNHRALDGVIINRGEMFHSPSGAIGPGPGLMGSAADDINCRCIKILILE
ncbi:MAG TPA: phage minor head protein, partial [Tissierellaceae bacterium]|nr:phage minor head protein [Tissierellaceae bacterium]